MESVKTNDEELTSTMGNLLSTSKDDKNDASDSTPTSSTDAFTTTSTSQIAADDPISSTSSDVLDSKKSTDKVNDLAQSYMSVMSSSPFMSSLKGMSMGDNTSPIVSEKDLLDMNITDTSTEKITENVDDIVQDLENLLGEPTTSFEFTIRHKDGNRTSSSAAEKDISMDIDAFSAELQMLSEQADKPKEVIKETKKVETAVVLQNNVTESLKTVASETLDTTEVSNKEYSELNATLEGNESSPLDSQSNELSTNTNDIKTDAIEKINDQIENCQFEFISASSANTEVITVEKSEFSEAQHITSTQSKNEECSPATEQIVPSKDESQAVGTEIVRDAETLTSSDEVKTTLEISTENDKPTVSEEATSEEKVDEVPEKTIECEEQISSNDVVSEEKSDETEVTAAETSSQAESNLESTSEPLINKFEEKATSRESEEMQVQEIKESKQNAAVDVIESLVDGSVEQVDDVQTSETFLQKEDLNITEEANIDATVSNESEAATEDSLVAEGVSKTQESSEVSEESAGSVEEANEAKTEEVGTVSDADAKSSVEEISQSIEVIEHVATVLDENPSNTTETEKEKVASVEIEVKRDEEKVDDAEEKMEIDATLVEQTQNEKMDSDDIEKVEKASIMDTADEVGDENTEVESTSTANDELAHSGVSTEDKEEVTTETGGSEEVLPVEEATEDYVKTEEDANDELAHSGISTQDKEERTTETGGSEEVLPVEEETEDYVKTEEDVPENSMCKQVDDPSKEEEARETEVSSQPLPFSSEEEARKEEIPNTADKEQSVSGDTVTVNVDQQIGDKDEEVLQEGGNEITKPLAENQVQLKTEEENIAAIYQTEISESTEPKNEQITSSDFNVQPEEAPEQSKPSLVELSALEPPSESLSAEDIEDVSVVAPVDFIPDSIEIPTRSLADDLDLLVQNAVNDDASVETPTLFEEKNDVATATDENLKSLEGVIENNILPLAMEDVPDLDVLNAISTLSDNKSTNIIPEVESIQRSDALLTSSSLEQSSTGDAPFEANIDSSLPTVEEIFAEPNQQQPVELQDDNLETLLAVASLQNVDYSIPPVDDFTPSVEAVPDYVPEEPAAVEEVPNFVSSEPAPPAEDSPTFLREKSGPTLDEESVPPVEDIADFVPEETDLSVSNFIPEESGLPIEDDARLGPKEAEFVSEEEPSKVEDVEIPAADLKETSGTVEEKDEPVVQEDKLKEPLIINIEENDKERVYSPKITIKPIKPPEEEETVSSASGENECSKGSLKMTITKQSDNTHSILKIYDPDDDNAHTEDHHHSEPSVPKLIIKSIMQPNEQPHSPKMSTRSSKQVFSPTSSSQRSASPRITIKPIPKPEESVAPLKITIKPVLKTDDGHKQKHSPKLTIKPIIKPDEEGLESKVHSPRVTIKPIVKPPEEMEQVSSPRITIKPIVKPSESVSDSSPTTPRVTIKPVVKPSEREKNTEGEQVERSSPKITIKPIVKPQEVESVADDYDDSVKERIVLKINKGTIPGSSKDLRKREAPHEEEKAEKLTKIKLKFSKEGGHPHIVQEQSPTKRAAEQVDHDKNKRQRLETEHFLPGVTITPIAATTHSKLKEMLSRNDNLSSNKVVTIDDDDDDVTIVEEQGKPSPIVISEESNQDSMQIAGMDLRDPISEIPVFEITPDSVKTINPPVPAPVAEVPAPPAPRKRGRPRKVPLQVREDFKDPKEEEPKPVVVESTRPKRSCRGQSVRTTLGIKPRKPRGPGRGRGSKRGMGTRSTPTPPETPPKPAKLSKKR